MADHLKFNSQTISDQKRLVRGEHLLRARTILRARDEVHHRRWRILMTAGGSPKGEVVAIRELMPKACIVAVDRDPRCLEAATHAGVDHVVECDLTEWTKHQNQYGKPTDMPAAAVRKLGPFDLIDLDLCAGANATTRDIFKVYRRILVPNGVTMFTFSYGRDVSEVFVQTLAEWRRKARLHVDRSDHYGQLQQERILRILNRFEAADLPEHLVGRLCYLFSQTELERIRSVMVYRGREMPMCSILHVAKLTDDFSFVQVEPGDFQLAVTYPEAANLYDCPQARIETWRRRFAAIKAAITRQEHAERSRQRPTTAVTPPTADERLVANESTGLLHFEPPEE